MKVLAIDTSTYVLGIAIVDNEKVVGELITNLKKNHSLRAMPAVEQLMKECGITPKDLDRIVVANGPGSYTGVRLGVTIAKTLAWSLNIPLVGVSSLQLLAANGRYFPGVICPIMDARRGQVFTGLYEWENDRLVTKREDINILLTDWLEEIKMLNKKVLFIGEDVDKFKEVIRGQLGEMAHLASFVQHNGRPSELCKIGMEMEPTNVHHFVPNYTRLAEAEAKWLEENKG
ncbi:tRNA (adenosine(37)-N6)-threonylcarbamoyltransferase complex dimerization subunit type 1 TsaB [Bacillus alkalisoli]|uniref:tRNA (adenosine(37)-N6)-threonylcarbamoyltransferase complex dimerization subunit type 1 TsaB n=1 Tax=Bacillus alkalisoli TaxID=2011008 RepID=UPI000C2350BD|nr:tRNA (adenosine(37)-N6)-threonylcarbamoyltransferase complex dimerization subunit type 1 TsaB [Bacillus alkalisoli]